MLLLLHTPVPAPARLRVPGMMPPPGTRGQGLTRLLRALSPGWQDPFYGQQVTVTGGASRGMSKWALGGDNWARQQKNSSESPRGGITVTAPHV